MDLKIFDVEHGACALLTCDDNTRLMIDCGKNAATGWFPGNYLRAQGIARLDMLAITNYDEDHVDGLPNLRENVDIGWLWRNKKVSSNQIRFLKSEDGMGRGIDELVYAIDNVFTGDATAPGPSFAGLRRTSFSNSPAQFDDENNLSMVVHLQCHGIGVMFPGDMETEGWLELLDDQAFQNACATHKFSSLPITEERVESARRYSSSAGRTMLSYQTRDSCMTHKERFPFTSRRLGEGRSGTTVCEEF